VCYLGCRVSEYWISGYRGSGLSGSQDLRILGWTDPRIYTSHCMVSCHGIGVDASDVELAAVA
jgi:hypothetical protein